MCAHIVALIMWPKYWSCFLFTVFIKTLSVLMCSSSIQHLRCVSTHNVRES